jgi:hypothetical protein
MKTGKRKETTQNPNWPQKSPEPNIYIREERRVFNFGLVVRGLSQRPNLTKGPAATWDFWRSSKEEEGKRTTSTKGIGIRNIYYRVVEQLKIKLKNRQTRQRRREILCLNIKMLFLSWPSSTFKTMTRSFGELRREKFTYNMISVLLPFSSFRRSEPLQKFFGANSGPEIWKKYNLKFGPWNLKKNPI